MYYALLSEEEDRRKFSHPSLLCVLVYSCVVCVSKKKSKELKLSLPPHSSHGIKAWFIDDEESSRGKQRK